MLNNLKVGADPEMFAFSVHHQEYVSLHGRFPGTKKTPYPVANGALQLDGVAAELNIHPAQNRWDFIHNIKTVMNEAKDHLPKGLVLHAAPIANFNEAYFDSLPQRAKELGCNPDNNAWNGGEENEPPGDLGPVRAAGGHIHLGWDTEKLSQDELQGLQIAIIKQMDYYVGLAQFEWDTDPVRRNLYGKAGAFRPKSYGVEYRTPSGAWLESEETMGRVFDLTQKAVDDFKDGKFAFQTHGSKAQDIINAGDVSAAKEVLDAVLVA